MLIKKIKDDRFGYDLIITFGGQMIVMLLAFVLNKIISNQYSVEMFGTYNLVRRFIGVITFVMLASQGIAIPKFIAESEARKINKKTESYMISSLVIIISLFMIITILMVGTKSWIGKTVLGELKAQQYVLPSCLYSFGSCLVTYAYSYYRGINKFIEYNIVNIIMQVGTIIICFIVPQNLLIVYYAWSIFLITYGGLEISKIFLKTHFSLHKIKEKLFTVPVLLKYSIPRIPGEFILFAYNLLPLTIITNKFGMEEVGYFSAAVSINSIITPLFSLVGTVLLPLVSQSKVNHSEKEVNSKIRILGIIYLIVGVIGVAFVYLFGELILTILFNKSYIACMPIVKLTILSIIPNSVYLLLRNPIDGISDFPHNTICLIVSFLVYIIMLQFSKTVEMCAIAMIVSYTFLGVLSFLVWHYISREKN